MGHIPNIDAISGTLFTLRIQYEYTKTQCDEGSTDGIDISNIIFGIWGLFGKLHYFPIIFCPTSYTTSQLPDVANYTFQLQVSHFLKTSLSITSICRFHMIYLVRCFNSKLFKRTNLIQLCFLSRDGG